MPPPLLQLFAVQRRYFAIRAMFSPPLPDAESHFADHVACAIRYDCRLRARRRYSYFTLLRCQPSLLHMLDGTDFAVTLRCRAATIFRRLRRRHATLLIFRHTPCCHFDALTPPLMRSAAILRHAYVDAC